MKDTHEFWLIIHNACGSEISRMITEEMLVDMLDRLNKREEKEIISKEVREIIYSI